MFDRLIKFLTVLLLIERIRLFGFLFDAMAVVIFAFLCLCVLILLIV
jgi:hypothetical protein